MFEVYCGILPVQTVFTFSTRYTLPDPDLNPDRQRHIVLVTLKHRGLLVLKRSIDNRFIV